MMDQALRRRIRRFVVRHRRMLAAGFAFLAVLSGLGALRGPSPGLSPATAETRLHGFSNDLLETQVAAPIRLSDAAAVALLNENDVIDVIAADGLGGSDLIAEEVEVIAIPQPPAESFVGRSTSGALVVLAVSTTQATALAAAAAVGSLSFVLRAD